MARADEQKQSISVQIRYDVLESKIHAYLDTKHIHPGFAVHSRARAFSSVSQEGQQGPKCNLIMRRNLRRESAEQANSPAYYVSESRHSSPEAKYVKLQLQLSPPKQPRK